MKVNFENKNCSTSTSKECFGICDESTEIDKYPAYVKFDNKETWIAVVVNGRNIQVKFTAIDNCIEILRENGEQDRRCDGMLTYEDKICFVELKKAHSGHWAKDGREQLEATIAVFLKNNDITKYKQKRAFISNPKHPQFHRGRFEIADLFFKTTRFRLLIQQEIKI